MRFSHAMLRVKDIDKSLAFYQEMFDMNITNKMRLEECDLYFLSDEDGQTQIEVTYNDVTPGSGYTHGTGFGHVAFEVYFEYFVKRLDKYDIKFTYPPTEVEGDDMKIAFIQDPDGYEIELVENY